MQHYFGTIVNGKAILTGDQVHHLIAVRRGQIGEKIEVSEEKESYLCEIISLEPLEIAVLRKIEHKRELDIDLTIAFAVLKGDKNDIIVLKGAELGVSHFIPFISKRCIVDVKDKEDKKRARLEKIALEGAGQCRRDAIPDIAPFAKFTDLLSLHYDKKFFAYEGEAGESNSLWKEALKLSKRESVLVVIGPEGGFDADEVALASDYGFTFVGLGRRILRAETACIYAATILGAASEE